MSLVPDSSKIMTCMPSLNPHNWLAGGQPAPCPLTFNSADCAGMGSLMVVCADVGGTYISVIVSLAPSEPQNVVVHLKVPGGSGEMLPSRSGRIVATYCPSEP